MRLIKAIGLIATVFLIVCLSSCGYERIDAGHVGIKVNLYGSDKGVADVAEVTGAVWFNPFRTEIHEFPTYIQDVSYQGKEKLILSTSDGLEVTIEVGLNYRVDQEYVVSIFKEYRKPLGDLQDGFIFKAVRSSFSEAIQGFSAEDSYAKKSLLLKSATNLLRKKLEPNFLVEELTYLSDPQPPASVKQNIEDKVNASQLALKKKSELDQAKADADKLIEKTRGEAESMKIKADAEKYTYEQKKLSLTPLIVQQQWIDKWNGHLPQYGDVPQLFKTID